MNDKSTAAFSCVLLLLITLPCVAEPVVTWDFRTGTLGWVGNAQVAPVQSTSEGLIVNCIGADPWIEGPAVDFPTDRLIRLDLCLRSNADQTAQVFYGPQFVAERVHTFMVFNDNLWHDYTLLIPDTPGPRTRFRLDPCGDTGHIVVKSISVSAVKRPETPTLPAPVPFDSKAPSVSLTAGNLTLVHSKTAWNALTLSYDGQALSQGYTGEAIGLRFENETEWLALNMAQVTATSTDSALIVATHIKDSQGATWQISRTFTSVPKESAVHVTTTLLVDRARDVIHVPWVTLLPGLESFGPHKDQALFAGLEYLSDEPSSSQADLTGPDHVRRMPDPVKVTFPLMAISANGHYLGLTWTPCDEVSPGFDSPDRVFGSASHAMWLSGPAVGNKRFANDLVAHTPMAFKANEPVSAQTVILAGRGQTVVPAIQQYYRLNPLPALPQVEGGYTRAVDLLTHGWLDSSIRENGRFRHAVWGTSFNPAPAADAAALMQMLSAQTQDAALAARLKQAVTQALSCLNPADPYASSVSHVQSPLAPLLFGRVSDYVHARHAQALAQLSQFDDTGRLLYRPQPDKPDYGQTHFAQHANGLGANTLASILDAATLCHDPNLTQRALDLLDQQTELYANTVPRGAQTWEIPLHTPDIMASAHLVRAYTLGYLLSNEPEYLEQARYWAWTGVPFVYLVNPSAQTTGPYATIAVLGATNWQAPVWLGQPVQWCGLVYGDALNILSKADPDGPWLKLSHGITLTGVQMTWPTSDTKRQGLLPDFYHLKAQVSDGPAINPGTVGVHLAEAFDQIPSVQRCKIPNRPGFIHAPGQISILKSGRTQLIFALKTRLNRPYHILISGLETCPASAHLTLIDTETSCTMAYDASLNFGAIPVANSPLTEEVITTMTWNHVE